VRRSAAITGLLGLITALLLANGATASATGRTSCSNGVNNIVTCNTVMSNVILKISGKRTLTAGEISILENNLNNTSIDVTVLKNVVVETYKSFNPSIDISVRDVNVCIASYCR
jgi:conjugal transfer/entry exclusion protein